MPDVLFNGIRQWLYSKFDPQKFPEDVTRLVFQHIRSTPHLYAAYEARIHEAGDQLHKEIGQSVKVWLEAEVVRSTISDKPQKIACNPVTDLVKGCTRLRPARRGKPQE